MAVPTLHKIAAGYWKISLWLLCALSLAGVLILRQMGELTSVQCIVIAVVFHLLAAVFYGQMWLRVAKNAPMTLPRFYMAASALRLFAAAATVLIYCVIARNDAQQIKMFAIIFMVYYVVMLIFDAVYFIRKVKSVVTAGKDNEGDVAAEPRA